MFYIEGLLGIYGIQTEVVGHAKCAKVFELINYSCQLH